MTPTTGRRSRHCRRRGYRRQAGESGGSAHAGLSAVGQRLVVRDGCPSRCWIYLAVRLVQNPTLAGNRPRGWSLVWRIVVAGVVAVISMPVLSIPTAVFGRGADANQDAQTVVYIVELVVVWVIGLALLYGQWRRLRAQPSLGAAESGSAYPFVVVFGPLFLIVHLVLWIAALPAFFDAKDGITADITPIGNLPYVIACFLVATFALNVALALALARGGRGRWNLETGLAAPFDQASTVSA